jgi:hypothetical protein
MSVFAIRIEHALDALIHRLQHSDACVQDRSGRQLDGGSILRREHRRRFAEMQHAAGDFWPGVRGAAAARAIDPVHGGEVGGKKVVALGNRSDCGSGFVTSDCHKGIVPNDG